MIQVTVTVAVRSQVRSSIYRQWLRALGCRCTHRNVTATVVQFGSAGPSSRAEAATRRRCGRHAAVRPAGGGRHSSGGRFGSSMAMAPAPRHHRRYRAPSRTDPSPTEPPAIDDAEMPQWSCMRVESAFGVNAEVGLGAQVGSGPKADIGQGCAGGDGYRAARQCGSFDCLSRCIVIARADRNRGRAVRAGCGSAGSRPI